MPKKNLPSFNSTIHRSLNTESLQISSSDDKRVITLMIKLDDWSPVREMWGMKYREKIAIDCFDYMQPIESQELSCYVDHDISIEKLIATTSNGTMRVSKSDNIITAEIDIDENDYISKKTADLIKSGAIKSNSFIFTPIETETKEYEAGESDVDFEVVFKKATLISIDPVYKGFYPQNEMSINKEYNNMDIKSIITRISALETQAANTKSRDDLASINAEIEELKAELAALEAAKAELEEANKVEEPSEEEKPTIANEGESNESTNTNNVDVQKVLVDNVLALREENKQISNLFNVAKQNNVKRELDTDNNYRIIRNKWLNKVKLSEEEKQVLARNTFIDDSNVGLMEELKLSLNKTGSDLKRFIDGTTDSNGLALIEILQNNRIIKEWNKRFPELTDYAQIIPLTGLNEVNQSILIQDKQEVASIAEGAKAITSSAKTSKVNFKPIRYAVEVKQSLATNNSKETLAATTESRKADIQVTLRKKFYTNMLAKAGVAFDIDTYDGGARAESNTTTSGPTVKIADINRVITTLRAKWGDQALTKYRITMHPNTLIVLEEEYFAAQSELLKAIYDPIKKTIGGIQIIMYDEYPDQIAAGKFPVVFWTTDSLVAYGCSLSMIDNPYENMSEEQISRYIRLRGEIKMCDPYFNTVTLKVAAAKANVK